MNLLARLRRVRPVVVPACPSLAIADDLATAGALLARLASARRKGSVLDELCECRDGIRELRLTSPWGRRRDLGTVLVNLDRAAEHLVRAARAALEGERAALFRSLSNLVADQCESLRWALRALDADNASVLRWSLDELEERGAFARLSGVLTPDAPDAASREAVRAVRLLDRLVPVLRQLAARRTAYGRSA